MRTGLFLLAGFLLLGGFAIVGKLFSHDFPAAPLATTALFVAFWLALTVFNLWVGVAKAGYTVAAELPILALLFGIPAAAAILLKWKFL